MAVFDCLVSGVSPSVSGVSPSVLVGRVELGSPSLYRVKAVRREVGELVQSLIQVCNDATKHFTLF